MHCVKCWPNITKLYSLQWNFLLRIKKISVSKMKQKKKTRNGFLLDSIEDEFKRVLKYDNNANVAYNHFHTQLDVAVFLYINYDIEKEIIANIVAKNF
jgi:hypothetical protein